MTSNHRIFDPRPATTLRWQPPQRRGHATPNHQAGDTFLSVLAAGAPLEVACFLASVAGAEAVATVGHRQNLDRVALLKHATTLLK